MYKVFIKLDKNLCVVGVESDYFYNEKELLMDGFVQVDRGDDGITYAHAQANYLDIKYGKPMYDEKNRPNFKYTSGNLVALTDIEKEELFPKPKPQPTQQDVFNATIMKKLASIEKLVKGGTN